jgi:cyclopropane fatty-acyl-phospholipid synthase-like methyltransferase
MQTGHPKSHDSESDNWDEHWTTMGEVALRNPANEYRIRLALQLLQNPQPGATILEIGSGQGQLALRLQEQFPQANVLGLEYSAEGVRRATEAARSAQVSARFVQRDLLVPSANGVDRSILHVASQAICSEVLEHVDEPHVLLQNASEYMLDGCRLLVTVPGGPMSALDRHIGHRRHYDPESLREVLEASNFHVEKIYRAGFPFFDLYRVAVIARGQKLVDSVNSGSNGALASRAQDWMNRFFQMAFHANLTNSPLGWQMVAIARLRRASVPTTAV